MKNNLLFIGMIFIGTIFLGISLIISALILSRPKIEQEQSINAAVNESLNQVDYSGAYNNSSDILLPYEAGALLGYDQEILLQYIKDKKLEGIPYVIVGDNYLFSKKALEEWIYSMTLKSNTDYSLLEKLIADLESIGFTVESTDTKPDLLTGERKWLTINQKENIAVYIYESNQKMEEAARHVSKEGSSYSDENLDIKIDWSSYPHYYKSENTIALYVGENAEIINNLEEIFGLQFAGYNPLPD